MDRILRWTSNLLLIVLLLGLFSILPNEVHNAHAAGISVKHVRRSLTVYSKPSQRSKKLASLPVNMPVFVTGKVGHYYRLNYHNRSGYALRTSVSSGKPKIQYQGYAADTVVLQDINSGKTLSQTLYLATPINVYARQGHSLIIGYGRGYYGYAETLDTHVVRYAKRGIDLSYLQSSGSGGVDFTRVKKADFHFAMIKASEGTDLPKSGTPDYFVSDVIAASKAGLKVHAYHMFDATSANVAQKEADHFAQRLTPVKKYLGYVFVDVEYENLSQNKQQLTQYVNAFISRLKRDGYNHVGIYSYYDFYKQRLDSSKLDLKGSLLWIARYNQTLGMKADVWQHRDVNCTISGVNGHFDFDLTYNKLIGG